MDAMTSFVGRRLAVAYNLAQCRREAPPKPGETCFALREKPTSSSPVLAYVPQVLLKDVETVIVSSVIKRIRDTGSRAVGAFVVGTVMPLNTRIPTAWDGCGISPVPPPKGRGELEFVSIDATGRRTQMRRADWFYGVGRKSTVSAPRQNPGRTVMTVAELRSAMVDLPDVCSDFWDAP